jgi:hypothetical protein
VFVLNFKKRRSSLVFAPLSTGLFVRIESLFNSKKKRTQKVLQYLSHQILRYMHGVLDVDERKN